jgi:hypothetical protein
MSSNGSAVQTHDGRASRALWFGVLGSPLAWGGHLLFNYLLEEWFACSPSATEPGHVLGFTVDTVSVVINTAMVVVATAAGLTALSCWRRLRAATDGDTHDRAVWMSVCGIIEATLFVPMILAGYAPPLILDTCAR